MGGKDCPNLSCVVWNCPGGVITASNIRRIEKGEKKESEVNHSLWVSHLWAICIYCFRLIINSFTKFVLYLRAICEAFMKRLWNVYYFINRLIMSYISKLILKYSLFLERLWSVWQAFDWVSVILLLSGDTTKRKHLRQNICYVFAGNYIIYYLCR